MGIKAAVFDYGGVIAFQPSRENEGELERLAGLPSETFWYLQRKYRGEWDRGTYNGTEYYRFILADAGVFPDDATIERIAHLDMEGWKRINQDTVNLIKEIKRAGLTTAILSNMPDDFYEWAKDAIPVFAEVNVSVISCKHKMIKPEAGIFKALRENIGCEFGEIAFFDDNAANVSAAKELGMQSFLWEGPDAARKIIASRKEALC
jgi:putative hydrolase of the HAD superfamily